ncbi:MAG: hypothetical protein WD431_00960 [Cyclobacteriaceae bacterium]
MLIRKFPSSFALLICLLLPLFPGFSQEFSTLDVSKFSFPSGLTANASQSRIAWAMNEQGRRNVYMAEGPAYQAGRLTDFMKDDGQEISGLQFSEDGEFLVFVRGGDHGGGNASRPVNANNMPLMTNVALWTIESYPVFTGQGNEIAFFSATPKRALLPAILKGGEISLLGKDLIPEDFPSGDLVIPKQVQFTAADGTTVYGQLFQPSGGESKKPAVVFVHGGPQRQMLLGWSYMDKRKCPTSTL